MDEDALREQIEQLQARVGELETQQQQPEGWLSRREAIASVVGTLGLGALTGQVAASDTDPGTYDCSFDGQDFDVGGNLWNVDGLDATQLLSALDVAGHDLADSGIKVYDASSDTLGDGTTNADHQSVSTDKIGSGGGVTTTDITDLEGPGIQVNGSNQLASDAAVPSSVAGSRSLGTWFQNTTGNPLLVWAVAGVGSGNVSDGDRIEIHGHINSSQTDNPIDKSLTWAAGGSAGMNCAVRLEVPDAAYYKVDINVDDTAALVIDSWHESERGV